MLPFSAKRQLESSSTDGRTETALFSGGAQTHKPHFTRSKPIVDVDVPGIRQFRFFFAEVLFLLAADALHLWTADALQMR